MQGIFGLGEIFTSQEVSSIVVTMMWHVMSRTVVNIIFHFYPFSGCSNNKPLYYGDIQNAENAHLEIQWGSVCSAG